MDKNEKLNIGKKLDSEKNKLKLSLTDEEIKSVRENYENGLNDQIEKSESELEELKAEEILEKKLSGKFELSTIQGFKDIEHNKEGLIQLYNNLNGIIKYSINNINKESPDILKSKRSRIVTALFISWIQKAGSTVAHEIGHSDKADSYGFETILNIRRKENGTDSINVFKLFIFQLTSDSHPFSNYVHSGNISIEQDTDISGAGLNTNTKIALDHIDNSLFNKKGLVDIVDSTSYLINKSYLLSYILTHEDKGDDIVNILKGINNQFDTEYSVGDITKYSVLSLLSGGVLTSLKQGYNFIMNDKYQTEIIGFDTPFGKVYLPEFQTYLNSNNISFQISDHVKLNNGTVIKFAIEENVIGKKGTEYTLKGINHINNKFSISGETTLGSEGQYYESRLDYKIQDKPIGIFIKGSHSEGNTNAGNRNSGNFVGVGAEYRF